MSQKTNFPNQKKGGNTKSGTCRCPAQHPLKTKENHTGAYTHTHTPTHTNSLTPSLLHSQIPTSRHNYPRPQGPSGRHRRRWLSVTLPWASSFPSRPSYTSPSWAAQRHTASCRAANSGWCGSAPACRVRKWNTALRRASRRGPRQAPTAVGKVRQRHGPAKKPTRGGGFALCNSRTPPPPPGWLWSVSVVENGGDTNLG